MRLAIWLGRTLRPVLGRLTGAALAGAGAMACGIALMATSAWLISRAAQHPPVLSLTVAVVAVRAFGIGRGLLRYVERLVSHDAAFRMLARVRVQLYTKLERLAPAGLGRAQWRRGELLRRLVDDVEALQDLALRSLLPATVAFVVGGATVGLLWALLPAAGIITAVALLIGGLAGPWTTGAITARAERRIREVRGHLTASTVGLVQGAADLLAFGAAEERLAQVLRQQEAATRMERRAARTTAAGAALGVLAIGAAVLACALVAISAADHSRLDGVLIAVLILTPLAAADIVATLPEAAQRLLGSCRSAQRVLAVLDTAEPVAEPEHPAAVPPGARVQVHHLRVSWPDASAPALDGIDLQLVPGRRIAVVGATGSGKSTLVAALLGFVPAEAGGILLNGTDSRSIRGDEQRSRFSVCDQDTYLFDSTIRANLLLARPGAADADLQKALERAGLADWVRSLPSGVDTPVGEHGAQVSGGERQRIALARVLLHDRPFVLLDEPTAHLDRRTAARLINDLLDATATSGTLLITHRPDGLERMNEVIVLEQGRIARRGSHLDLLRESATYREMWADSRGPVHRSEPTTSAHRELIQLPRTTTAGH